MQLSVEEALLPRPPSDQGTGRREGCPGGEWGAAPGERRRAKGVIPWAARMSDPGDLHSVGVGSADGVPQNGHRLRRCARHRRECFPCRLRRQGKPFHTSGTAQRRPGAVVLRPGGPSPPIDTHGVPPSGGPGGHRTAAGVRVRGPRSLVHRLCELVCLSVEPGLDELDWAEPAMRAPAASSCCSRSASLRSGPGFEEGVEAPSVEVLIAHPTVERLDPGVLPGAARVAAAPVNLGEAGSSTITVLRCRPPAAR